ncbi:MAG: MBOAT family protein [Lachnospiraceae bacterium]|nr:MBOAT family protein [Lachnospiraceae bacterium]
MKNVKWIALAIFSMLFYSMMGVTSFLFCMGVTLLIWVMALFTDAVKRKDIPVFIGVILVLSMWTVQKINVITAIGVSFYSLQGIGYLLDVRNGKYKAESNPLKFILFMAFFPLSFQGPICRYDELMPRLTYVKTREERMSSKNFSRGLVRTVFGLFKKLVIADRLAAVTTVIFSGGQAGFGGLWVAFGLLVYTVRLYNDFTGGIDLIMGLAEVMGVELPENFKKPFTARTLAEYWTKWHITLAGWFKTYVFYPLSAGLVAAGVKSAGLVLVVSMSVTWLLVGLWHGLSLKFIAWGLFNACILIASKFLGSEKKLADPENGKYSGADYLRMVRTVLLVSGLRIFDVYESLTAAFTALTGIGNMTGLSAGFGAFGLTLADYIIVAVGCLFVALMMKQTKTAHIADGFLAKSEAYSMIFTVLMLFITVIFAKYGRDYNAGAFIYGNFI